MSSRRKSSTPCMVRVSEAVEGGDDEDNAAGAEATPTSDDDLADTGSSPRQQKKHPERPSSVHSGESACPPQEGGVVGGEEEQDVGEEEAVRVRALLREPMHKTLHKQQGGYECKYCPFSTQKLSTFKEHVDTTHPNVILNPLYLCAVCNFSTRKFDSLTEHNDTQHPGESNFKFKRIKLNSQTILEQTIESEQHSLDLDNEDVEILGGIPDLMLGESTVVVKARKPKEIEEKHMFGKGEELQKHFESLISKDQITAVNVNGTVIIPDPTILQGLSHVMPLLQRPPNLNSAPKIAVPLNTTKYNPLLDNNAILITSFNKFPYPTHAELSWLTAASKHPEEQIKVWFTTQRLKQGITWSPEEVEEARKKMFNGSIPPVHHTFTVLPDSVTAPAKSLQPQLSQAVPGSVLGPPSAAVSSRTSLLASPSVTVTTVSHVQSLKRPLAVPGPPTEIKRAMMASSVDHLKDKTPMPPPPPPVKDRLPMAPPPVPPEIRRPASSPFLAPPDMKRPLLAPIVSLKGKPPVALPLVASKERLPMPPPLMLPKERLASPLAFPTEIKRPMLLAPKSKNQLTTLPVIASDVKLPMAPPLTVPQMKRPTIIQTARGPSKTLPLPPSFPLETWQPKEPRPPVEPRVGEASHSNMTEKETNGFDRGESNSWLQSMHYLNGSVTTHTKSNFVPMERPKPVPTQFPLLERVKGKTTEQLKILEESFQRNSFPSHAEADSLATVTRLSREEIDSWFLERRALRDNLEQALLNSMGAKRLDSLERRHQLQQQQPKQNTVLNGAHKPAGPPLSPLRPIVAPASSPTHLDGKSLGLLKDVFAQTQWPSPEEYTILESQTGLARTEIVRWFKDSRSELRNGTLDWLEGSHKFHGSLLNGQGFSLMAEHGTSKVIQRCQDAMKMAPPLPLMTAMTPRADDPAVLRECAKLKSEELKEWFANTLGHAMPDMNGRNMGQNGGARGACGVWMQEPLLRGAGGGVTKELVSDTD